MLHVHAQLCPILCDPLASLSMGFFRQEYWGGIPFPSPGDLHNPRIERVPAISRTLQADSFYTLSHQGRLSAQRRLQKMVKIHAETQSWLVLKSLQWSTGFLHDVMKYSQISQDS